MSFVTVLEYICIFAAVIFRVKRVKEKEKERKSEKQSTDNLRV